MTNPLVADREIEFLLYEVLDVEGLCGYEHFADHSRETFDSVLQTSRRLAREVLFPAYRAMDAEPPELGPGGVTVHPAMKELLPRLADLGILAAHRPYAVGGMQLPLAVSMAAQAYLMAANLSAFGYVGLTSGAAHLIEAFGDEHLRTVFMPHLYAGEWTGTMALTEPDAGSSLGDLTTTASPRPDGTYGLRGGKIFISGGDHDLTENIVHMTLARIEGADAGTRGISLFAVPKRRPLDDGELVDNDLHVAGVIHKIGWRGLPSLVMSYGESGDCVGWLVGEPGQGLRYMFQMMNEARLMVGLNGIATASAAYHESVAYARERPQGRGADRRDGPQVPIIEHADVRRMLLRQKAIVEGGLTLLGAAAVQADLAVHAADETARERARLLLDLLTPMAKSFPAEAGFEATTLAVQVHGGYGYTSEYLPESWLRDQKLNSIHEGTTGIQGLDLLGRRAVAGGGAALTAFADATAATIARARTAAGVAEERGEALADAVNDMVALTGELGARGAAGDVEAMMRHSADYLDALSTVAVAWQHLERAAAAGEGRAAGRGPAAFYDGVEAAADYWFATELPTVAPSIARIRSGEDSYARMRPDWF